MRPGSGQRATETRLNPARGSRARGAARPEPLPPAGRPQDPASRPAAPPARLPEPGSAVTRALGRARPGLGSRRTPRGALSSTPAPALARRRRRPAGQRVSVAFRPRDSVTGVQARPCAPPSLGLRAPRGPGARGWRGRGRGWGRGWAVERPGCDAPPSHPQPAGARPLPPSPVACSGGRSGCFGRVSAGGRSLEPSAALRAKKHVAQP